MKVAVVLYNLGGPDRAADVRPFLFNLFNDPCIIALPAPLRWIVAKLVSARRARVAQGIYDRLGGGSPLLANTNAQADALRAVLPGDGGNDYRIFVAMRYWHPMADAVARKVSTYAPEQIILLPLYPQFSTTTVGSFLRVWQDAAERAGIACPTRTICCFPIEAGFIAAIAESVRAALDELRGSGPVRVLFSAHGLPKKVVAQGDPYQWQVEQTARAVVDQLAVEDLDWVTCYQSRVGPLEWIGPATEDEIRRAGADGVGLVVVPVAFVSEHSETLVELDIEYRHVAEAAGVRAYHRVPTVGTAAPFIAGLARLVSVALADAPTPRSGSGGRICPQERSRCPCAVAGR